MEQVIGRCSNCGGQVVQHFGAWYGVVPPTPHCRSCNYVPSWTQPVIPMVPPANPGYTYQWKWPSVDWSKVYMGGNMADPKFTAAAGGEAVAAAMNTKKVTIQSDGTINVTGDVTLSAETFQHVPRSKDKW